jgi:hypothetical protein
MDLFLAAGCAGPAGTGLSLPRSYEEEPNVAAALERVKTKPQKHVLLYFGMSEFCPPRKEARAILTSEAVRSKWRPNYVVVNIDMYAPTPAERDVIEQVRVSWAPVRVLLDGEGRRVAGTVRSFVFVSYTLPLQGGTTYGCTKHDQE